METVQERFEAVKEGAVKQLTRKTFVDVKGELDLFWGEDSEIKHYHFKEIDSAISQCIHVLNRLRGNLEEILGKSVLIPGETQRMQNLVKKLQSITIEFLDQGFLDERGQRAILKKLQEISLELERSSVPTKREARHLIDKVRQSNLIDEKNRKKPSVAVKTSKATTELAKRYEDVSN